MENIAELNDSRWVNEGEREHQGLDLELQGCIKHEHMISTEA